jgi:septal ring factor EnvC (AmiA/AmiB activator)
MRYGCAIALCWVLTGGHALAQSDTRAVDPELQQKQADDLRAMEEQRAQLLRELQQLREEIAASEARMAASQERTRKLQSQQPPPAQSKP